MIGRRGFLCALAGMPIAAVVMPKVSVPEVTTAPLPVVTMPVELEVEPSGSRNHVNITIHCDTRAFERDLARIQAQISDTITRQLQRRPLPIARSW